MDLGIDKTPPAGGLTVPVDLGPDDSIREILRRTPNSRRVVIETAFRCLNARKFFFDKSEGCMVFEPDYKTQLDAVKFLAAYGDGLPVQTNVNVEVGKPGPGDDEDLARAIERSPALRAHLLKLVGPSTT